MKTNNKINNLSDMLATMTNLMEEVRDGKIEHVKAGVMNDTCGKYTSLLSLQLRACELTKTTPDYDRFGLEKPIQK